MTTNTAAGSISQKALAVTGQTATSKVYDTTVNAGLSGGALTGVIGAESVNLVAGMGSFANKNVGTAKAVTVTGTGLSGGDAANYTVANPTGLTANITPATISSVSGITAYDKPQDGNTSATLGTGAAGFNGRLGADVLTVGAASGNFDTSLIGNGKTVNISGIALGGTDARNYVLANTSAVTTASILPSAGSVRLGNAMATPLLETVKKGCTATGADAGNQDEASVQRNALPGAGESGSRGGGASNISRNSAGTRNGACS